MLAAVAVENGKVDSGGSSKMTEKLAKSNNSSNLSKLFAALLTFRLRTSLSTGSSENSTLKAVADAVEMMRLIAVVVRRLITFLKSSQRFN